jgi:ABC-type iron transport system FetAB ATPase subunit
MFPSLFGGGKARLVMTGDEILDAGVQVMAQPPGKKNSTIHLLSGGEKALTAIALVFAIFQLNPAPFCLLDEVDAPLDDANTERYAKLVAEMSQGHAVPVHQPQQDRDGDGRAADRRDHAGAGRVAHRGGGHGVRGVDGRSGSDTAMT